MALNVRIGAYNYSCADNYNIRQQGGTISSTELTVRIGSNPRPISLQSCQIIIDGTPVFAGIINRVESMEISTGYEERDVKLSIQSMEVIFSWRMITKNYYNKYINEIVQDIFDNYIATEGISLGEISSTMKKIDAYRKKDSTVQAVLDDLAKQLDGCIYYISPDKKFYFITRNTFTEVAAPVHVTELKLAEDYGDLRTVQKVTGSSSTIVGVVENQDLIDSVASLSGTSGRIEKNDSDQNLHNTNSVTDKAQTLINSYAEREKTLELTCHDLSKSQLYTAWVFGSGFPAEIQGTYVVNERTISNFYSGAYNIKVSLKNRNYFARYGYSIKKVENIVYDAVNAIGDIMSTDKLTPVEKIALRDRWNTISTEKQSLDDLANYHSIGQEKNNYDNAFQELATYLNGNNEYVSGVPLWLTDSRLPITEDIVRNDYDSKLNNYETAKAALNSAIGESPTQFFYGDEVPNSGYHVGDFWVYQDALFISNADRAPGQGLQSDWEWYIRPNIVTDIQSTNGNIFKPGQSMTTTLVPRCFKNGVEITDTIPDSAFKWTRTSFYPRNPPDDDYTWNANHASGYRTIEVTCDSIYARATYVVEIFE